MRQRLTGTVLGMALCVVLSQGAGAQEIHSRHCLYGCPYGGDFSNDLLIRESYILRSNDLTRIADWVAYRVTRDTIGKAGRRALRPDPLLRENEALEPEDYRGAAAELHMVPDRQVPEEAFAATPYAAEADLMSNVVTRDSTLARGPWRRLDEAIYALTRRPSIDAVYVMAGPIFEDAMVGLPGADEPHVIPSAFWKIVAVRSGRGAKVVAFAFAQHARHRAGYCGYQTSLRAIEQRTGLTFFHDLRGPLEPLAAALRCPPQ